MGPDPNTDPGRYETFALAFVAVLKERELHEYASLCESHMTELIQYFKENDWNTSYAWFDDFKDMHCYGLKDADNKLTTGAHCVILGYTHVSVGFSDEEGDLDGYKPHLVLRADGNTFEQPPLRTD